MNRPVELVLVDQDDQAHETAHRRLTRLLVERQKDALPVTRTLPSLLGPADPQARRRRRTTPSSQTTLSDLDLVYSAGLYDYLPDPVGHAPHASSRTPSCRPGGRLLLGNLIETPDSTWIMDYVLGWQLLYRTDETMLSARPPGSPRRPRRLGITRDATGRCLFLDVDTPVIAATSPRARRVGCRPVGGPHARSPRAAPEVRSEAVGAPPGGGGRLLRRATLRRVAERPLARERCTRERERELRRRTRSGPPDPCSGRA